MSEDNLKRLRKEEDMVDDDDDDEENEAKLAEREEKEREEKTHRRKLRTMQRDIFDEIEKNRMELLDINTGKYDELRDKTNNIFKEIRHTREQLNDATIFKRSTGILKTIAVNAEDISRRYDFGTFASAIKDKYTDRATGLFSWTALGNFNSAL